MNSVAPNSKTLNQKKGNENATNLEGAPTKGEKSKGKTKQEELKEKLEMVKEGEKTKTKTGKAKKGKTEAKKAEPKEESTHASIATGNTESSKDGETVFRWVVEYAKSGRAKCQATGELIPQGAMRIGKEVDNPYKPGTRMCVWSTVPGLFASFRKGKAYMGAAQTLACHTPPPIAQVRQQSRSLANRECQEASRQGGEGFGRI